MTGLPGNRTSPVGSETTWTASSAVVATSTVLTRDRPPPPGGPHSNPQPKPKKTCTKTKTGVYEPNKELHFAKWLLRKNRREML